MKRGLHAQWSPTERNRHMQHTISDVLRTATTDYLNSLNPAAPPPPAQIEFEMLQETRTLFENENSGKTKGDKWPLPKRLSVWQIANIIAFLYPVCCIATAEQSTDKEYDLLCMYQEDGPDKGIYVSSDDVFRKTAREYDVNLSPKEFSDCMVVLRDLVPRRSRNHDKNLIAVNNGIFDYDTKTLIPFSPDYVFMSKSRVDYNPAAKNVTIHNPTDGTDWDVESWMHTLSDDDEIIQLLWEILGAIIRPNVPWNKSAWFYSESGNNGKGTLCELMRQLCGEGSYASISLSDMGKDFALEPLVRTTSIIVDENDVGTFIDKAANLKAIITNDVIQINRKFKQPIPYRFYGFMVQCLNEMPRIKDKSDSFFRRQLFVPFEKCFTGIERKYIKTDYLHRKEVLEYVLYKILNMSYYELSVPQRCMQALEEYREFNDPVRQFAEEILPECRWTLIPYTFLYDLYRSWFSKNAPSGSPQGKTTFTKDLINIIKDSPEFEPSEKQVKRSTKMDDPEPLIAQYNLRDWMNLRYLGANDIVRLCTTPVTTPHYRGLLRKIPWTATVKTTDDNT